MIPAAASRDPSHYEPYLCMWGRPQIKAWVVHPVPPSTHTHKLPPTTTTATHNPPTPPHTTPPLGEPLQARSTRPPAPPRSHCPSTRAFTASHATPAASGGRSGTLRPTPRMRCGGGPGHRSQRTRRVFDPCLRTPVYTTSCYKHITPCRHRGCILQTRRHWQNNQPLA